MSMVPGRPVSYGPMPPPPDPPRRRRRRRNWLRRLVDWVQGAE